MDRELLIEIGCEEIPASWLPGLTTQLAEHLDRRRRIDHLEAPEQRRRPGGRGFRRAREDRGSAGEPDAEMPRLAGRPVLVPEERARLRRGRRAEGVGEGLVHIKVR